MQLTKEKGLLFYRKYSIGLTVCGSAYIGSLISCGWERICCRGDKRDSQRERVKTFFSLFIFDETAAGKRKKKKLP